MSPQDHARRVADRLRIAAVALDLALIALVGIWLLSASLNAKRVLLAVLFTLPLWAPLHGLIKGQRRTYAWATLCVIPYFILGITETIANPATRGWTGTCLALALVLFVGLIGYLRVTRTP